MVRMDRDVVGVMMSFLTVPEFVSAATVSREWYAAARAMRRREDVRCIFRLSPSTIHDNHHDLAARDAARIRASVDAHAIRRRHATTLDIRDEHERPGSICPTLLRHIMQQMPQLRTLSLQFDAPMYDNDNGAIYVPAAGSTASVSAAAAATAAAVASSSTSGSSDDDARHVDQKSRTNDGGATATASSTLSARDDAQSASTSTSSTAASTSSATIAHEGDASSASSAVSPPSAASIASASQIDTVRLFVGAGAPTIDNATSPGVDKIANTLIALPCLTCLNVTSTAPHFHVDDNCASQRDRVATVDVLCRVVAASASLKTLDIDRMWALKLWSDGPQSVSQRLAAACTAAASLTSLTIDQSPLDPAPFCAMITASRKLSHLSLSDNSFGPAACLAIATAVGQCASMVSFDLGRRTIRYSNTSRLNLIVSSLVVDTSSRQFITNLQLSSQDSKLVSLRLFQCDIGIGGLQTLAEHIRLRRNAAGDVCGDDDQGKLTHIDLDYNLSLTDVVEESIDHAAFDINTFLDVVIERNDAVQTRFVRVILPRVVCSPVAVATRHVQSQQHDAAVLIYTLNIDAALMQPVVARLTPAAVAAAAAAANVLPRIESLQLCGIITPDAIALVVQGIGQMHVAAPESRHELTSVMMDHTAGFTEGHDTVTVAFANALRVTPLHTLRLCDYNLSLPPPMLSALIGAELQQVPLSALVGAPSLAAQAPALHRSLVTLDLSNHYNPNLSDESRRCICQLIRRCVSLATVRLDGNNLHSFTGDVDNESNIARALLDTTSPLAVVSLEDCRYNSPDILSLVQVASHHRTMRYISLNHNDFHRTELHTATVEAMAWLAPPDPAATTSAATTATRRRAVRVIAFDTRAWHTESDDQSNEQFNAADVQFATMVMNGYNIRSRRVSIVT